MSVYEFGSFQLDVGRLLLLQSGQPVAVGPKVVETLLALVEHPGEVLTKSALVERIWPEAFVEEANLAQNIHVLRRTFRHYGCADPIETVPRRGYRFAAAVRHGTDLTRPQSARATPVARFRPAGTLFAMRSRVAAALGSGALVAASLALFATSGHAHRAGTKALSPGAARLYQIGRYYWNLRTRDGVRKSLMYFARVVDADPQDPRGYAALADGNLTMGDYCYGTHRPAVYFARAREYADRALALDPRSTEAHASLGFLALHRENATLAATELQRAIALDPSYAPAHEWYGIALVRSGRLSEGLVQLRTAANLEPLSVATVAWLGSGAYLQRRFDDAIAYARQALELAPERLDALNTIGDAYESQGDIDAAIDAFRRYGAVDPYYRPQAAALLARAYAAGHRLPEARAELAYARAHADRVKLYDLAAAVAAVEGRSAARDVLRHGRGHRSSLAVEDAAHMEMDSAPA